MHELPGWALFHRRRYSVLELHGGKVLGGGGDHVHGLLGRLLHEQAESERLLSVWRWQLRQQRGEHRLHGLPRGLPRLEHGRIELRGVRQRLLLGVGRGVVH